MSESAYTLPGRRGVCSNVRAIPVLCFSGTTGFYFDGDGVISSGCDARLEKAVRVGEGVGGWVSEWVRGDMIGCGC